MPFIVKIDNSDVKVLGTHFNIMGYSDEGIVKTTLLEGSVKFINNNINVLLKPGQQSQFEEGGHVKL